MHSVRCCCRCASGSCAGLPGVIAQVRALQNTALGMESVVLRSWGSRCLVPLLACSIMLAVPPLLCSLNGNSKQKTSQHVQCTFVSLRHCYLDAAGTSLPRRTNLLISTGIVNDNSPRCRAESRDLEKDPAASQDVTTQLPSPLRPCSCPSCVRANSHCLQVCTTGTAKRAVWWWHRPQVLPRGPAVHQDARDWQVYVRSRAHQMCALWIPACQHNINMLTPPMVLEVLGVIIRRAEAL